ncbi:MAG: hypothetical protein A2Y33_09110 [Spirochaetes bacterium GWF1_51_8]|nr:MAG: hypothetical protein A2Y33_09110 [Spirochaetes bacterium GWF1_51_8]
MREIFLAFFLLCPLLASGFDFVIVKYRSGDWYNASDGVKNFLAELAQRTTVDTVPLPVELPLDDDRIFEHSFLFLNGHVPVLLDEKEKANLKKFILNGGFLFANDDYGLDESFRKLIAELFPGYPFEQVSFAHPLYHSFYHFDKGLPKIHEHDGGTPEGWGLFIDGRLAVFYAYNADIADGWDYPEVHNDPVEKREAAFRMGVNIVIYSLTY